MIVLMMDDDWEDELGSSLSQPRKLYNCILGAQPEDTANIILLIYNTILLLGWSSSSHCMLDVCVVVWSGEVF